MGRGPFNFRALLALALLCCLKAGHASRDYQLVVNFQNTTAQAETVAVWWAGVWFTALQNVWFNCEFVEPGEKASRRLLQGEKTSSGPGLEGSGARTLRGRRGDRRLQVPMCPSTCAASGSTKCRSLGCAFCGRCRRARRLQTANSTETRITPTAALGVEKFFNYYLMTLCYSAKGCMIYAKVYRILNNGTSYPLTGNTIAV